MSLIMKDQADRAWLLGRSTDKEPDFKAKLATAVLLGLLVIVGGFNYGEVIGQENSAAYSPENVLVGAPAPADMISPDMQSYIENYHAVIDEYGVE